MSLSSYLCHNGDKVFLRIALELFIIVHLRSDEMISKHAIFGKLKLKNIKSWKNGGMEIPIHKGFGHIVYAAEKVSG